ncbi:aminotransferase class I/II-fold pyridoxal phosphate-dependent enzyme [Rhodococcus sp. 14C212]|uniref:pyridoxal phosphate-dependent aminotransferase n=1 Tax=Rhodococcus sp. 14C212 TaxID=2711209 RepID=UPI0013ECC11C|nr:aminotransferase class I/II-fold pyridoxal phosphate-dependent enzyme [Rhodococcus sp. 14C212]NGP07333.1 aminotransferase class I/II-fold pyridoxal phosphate-dependent enzyme [Rhodococcus sp. 14C212]
MTGEITEATTPSAVGNRTRPARHFELGLSENPFPPLPSVLAALHEQMARANRYPEFLPQRLPRIIADRVGVDPAQVVVGSGATGVAMQIMQAVLGDGETMAFATPTFDGYPIMADMMGVEAVTVPLDRAGRQDLGNLGEVVDDRTGLVVVCRPHNPTGTLVSAADLEVFLSSIPPRVVVILDEAYVEFIDAADAVDVLDLIRRYPNVIVLRTFSKAFGLAGLRIGYAFGGQELVARVRRRQLPFGMSCAAVAAVTASYAAEDELQARVARITAERELLRVALRQNGVHVPRSHANFLYLRGPHIAPALQRAGIVAKFYTDGSARIAVGDPAAGRAVLWALRTM